MPERSLYGGCIVCLIPKGWNDLSTVRQVPDHQECWQDEEGRLLIMEILDRQDDVDDSSAALFFHDDLADANGVTLKSDSVFSPLPSLPTSADMPPDAISCVGIGYQNITKKGLHEKSWIKVELCLMRLPSSSTDILITLSSPSDQNPQDVNNDLSTSCVFQEIISSFRICDWSLFK